MAAANMNRNEFLQAMEGSKPVLVDFWAPWCVYCRRIAPAYERIADQFGSKLLVAKVNIDDEPLLANQEHIEVIPTLVLYQNGEAIASIVAPESKAAIEEFINENLG